MTVMSKQNPTAEIRSSETLSPPSASEIPVGTTPSDRDVDGILADFDENSFSTVFTASGVPGIEFTTPYEICLRPFLEALGWEGEDRQIVEAFPHMDSIDDLDSFRAVVARLGFQTKTYNLRLDQIGNDQLPAIAVFSDGKPVIILSNEHRQFALTFDPETFDFRELELDATHVACCLSQTVRRHGQAASGKKLSWFTSAVYGLRRPLTVILGLTFIANLLALATPIYVMNVYNLVIGSKNPETLPFMFAAAALTISFEVFLKVRRGKLLAFVGARLGAGVINSGFARLLGLPVNMIESAPISTQITRLKQFEGTHTFFTGPIGVALFDLPFVLLFFAAIAIISPALALVPIALACVFAILAAITIPGARRRNVEMSAAVADSNGFLTDAISKKTSIHQLRVEQDWQRRFVGISRELAHKRFKVQFVDSMLGVVSQSLLMLAGVSTLLIGAIMVMAQELSVGGLIAVMMLIWRILAPIQTVFTNLNRISQFVESVKQIDVLMRIPLEYEKGAKAPVMRRFQGRVTFGGVAFRYGAHQEPVFRGLNLDIPPRQFVCISSATAGGKSTMLKLVLGLYKPQAGAIFLDGLNLQQLDPAEVRASIGYLPLEPKFFHGTVAQNMRLSAPTATNEEINQALTDSGLNINSSMFPDGIETRLTAEKLATIPIGTLQSLSLARMYCRKSAIYCFNDPSANLDADGERALERQLLKMRGTATIILISSRSNHLRMCDRVIKLEHGGIAEDYAPESTLDKRFPR